LFPPLRAISNDSSAKSSKASNQLSIDIWIVEARNGNHRSGGTIRKAERRVEVLPAPRRQRWGSVIQGRQVQPSHERKCLLIDLMCILRRRAPLTTSAPRAVGTFQVAPTAHKSWDPLRPERNLLRCLGFEIKAKWRSMALWIRTEKNKPLTTTFW
jgi:hypothetical protein